MYFQMARNERFPSSFQFHIQTLVQVLTTHIVQKYKDSQVETRNANTNLAKFVKVCLNASAHQCYDQSSSSKLFCQLPLHI